MNAHKQTCVSSLAINAITLMQDYIQDKGYTPVIHFELEGCFSAPSQSPDLELNYAIINRQLSTLGIEGELIPEYWKNQWEYVSAFNGQSPLTEAHYLAKVIEVLPNLFAQQGIYQTHIKPVVWNGDKRKMPLESNLILSDDNRDVHIPNAIQINVSVNDSLGENIIIKHGFGEYLQQCLLATGFDCALLFLPEEEAFERLALKKRYGLTKELSSPSNLSGGHQGSIALYKQWGKHNQQMGEEVIVYDAENNPTVTFKDWEKTARIEHRLGASSLAYNPFVNVAYILMNVIRALDLYINGECASQLKAFQTCQLPESLYSEAGKMGAIDLFENNQWFNLTLNNIAERSSSNSQGADKLGDALKSAIISHYRQPKNKLS